MSTEEEKLRWEIQKLQREQTARAYLAEQNARKIVLPPVKPLNSFLDEPDSETPWIINGVFPERGSAVLAAKQKTGKSTMVGNLIRCLVDGQPFLGRYETNQLNMVVLFDVELSENMLRRWLRDQGIKHTERVRVVSLRGRLSSFNIMNPKIRELWAPYLDDADLVILDPLRPILDALGLNEHTEAGKFLEAFDELCGLAGDPARLVVHHAGHGEDRARGDSRILDWPDTNMVLSRSKDDDEGDGPRFFKANGRDVDIPKVELQFNPVTRHLTVTDKAEKHSMHLEKVVRLVVGKLDKLGACSKTRLVNDLAASSPHPRKDVRDALAEAAARGYVSVSNAKHGAHVYEVTDQGRQFASLPNLANSTRQGLAITLPVCRPLKGRQGGNLPGDLDDLPVQASSKCDHCGDSKGPGLDGQPCQDSDCPGIYTRKWTR